MPSPTSKESNKNNKKKLTFLEKYLLLVVVIIGVFMGGLFLGRNSVECEICPPRDIDFSLFWETYNKLQNKFIDPQKIQDQQVIYGAISGMVEILDDPYTVFFDPQETQEFEEQLSGIYQGIGAEIGIKEGQLRIVAPLEDTPAQRAGLRAGDKILEIGGKSTLDMSVEKAVSLIRGKEGTEITLTILRTGQRDTQQITIKRAEIKIPSIKWELKENNIAYIHIYQFNRSLLPEFRTAAVEILSSQADRIIIDVRNNPGGYLSVAQDIAGWFLEEGKVVVIEDFGKDQKKYVAEGNSKFSDWPVVVLINEGSASGAEILAGALRDNKGVKLIGKTSFGKGSIQQAINLERADQTALLKVTVAKWLTPNGKSISEVGLAPDIEVNRTEEDYQQGKDPQLERAIEYLKE